MSELLERTRAALKALDPELEPTAPGYSELIIILAAIAIGAEEGRIANELGYDHEFVALVGARLRNSGIWDGADTCWSDLKEWTEETGGGIAFYLAGHVAAGAMEVVGHGPNGREYRLTETGLRDAAALIKKMTAEK